MNSARYDCIGVGYSMYRVPDKRIARHIDLALGDAHTVLNIGAGTGSYEPVDRAVVAVEPSTEMIRQRGPTAAVIIRASAACLPFRTESFDAALAVLTIHHWSQRLRGLREMQRVARHQIVVLTWDPDHAGFWLLQDYFPEILEIDQAAFPPISEFRDILGLIDVQPILIPHDCSDGFLGAYWRRPNAYLDRGARQAISTFSKLSDAHSSLRRLENDLATGVWEQKYRRLLSLPELDVGYRLIIGRKAA